MLVRQRGFQTLQSKKRAARPKVPRKTRMPRQKACGTPWNFWTAGP